MTNRQFALFFFLLDLGWSGAAFIYDLPALAFIPSWFLPFIAICPLYPLLLGLTWAYHAWKKPTPPLLAAFAIFPSLVYGTLALFFYPALLIFDHFSWNALLQIFWVWVYAGQAAYLFRHQPVPFFARLLASLFIISSVIVHYLFNSFGYLDLAVLPIHIRFSLLILALSFTLFFLFTGKDPVEKSPLLKQFAKGVLVSACLVVLAYFSLPIFRHRYFSPIPGPVDNTDWEIGEVASGLTVPWDLAFISDNHLLITERAGTVKLVDLQTQSLREITQLSQVSSTGESGLTGLAVHPDFTRNNHLYLYYSYKEKLDTYNRVSRFTYHGSGLTEEKIILDKLPGGSIHNGGRLQFGPDQKLWILTGDAGNSETAQDLSSLGGKVLRLNDDGSIPADNPYPGSAVYSSGHRNPQGLAWHPETGQLLVASHGQQAYDEINLVVAKGNYGWPIDQECVSSQPDFIDPVLCSNSETWAPSGIAFQSFTNRKNSLFFAGLRSGLLERAEFANGKLIRAETIINGQYGRLRAVTAGPDGALYVSTSNQDGRGTPQLGDDKILRLNLRPATSVD